MRASALWALVVLASAAGGARAQEPRAVVIAVGDAPAEELLRGARDAGGARWVGRALEATRPPVVAPPAAALRALEEAYFERGELQSCLARAQAPELQVDRLLIRGDRETAARALALGATCAFQANDAAIARALFDRAATAELDLSEPLTRAPPDVQSLYAEARRAVAGRPRRAVEIVTDPPGATLRVDGEEETCAEAPCRLQLRDGPHVLVAEHLGYRARVLELEVSGDEAREVALDRAPSALARSQLGHALHGGVTPDDLRLLRAAADAYSSAVVVVGWREGEAVRAALFDRSRDERGVLARASAPAREGERAVAEVVALWRGLEPTPPLESPWLWLGAALLAGAAVAATVLAIELQPDPQFSFVVP